MKNEQNMANQYQESSKELALISFEQDAMGGLEHVDRECLAIPRINILQALSPKMLEVDGAKQGMMIDSITNDLFESLLVIPFAFQRRYTQWIFPREKGSSGYKGEHSVSDLINMEAANTISKEDGKIFFEGDELKDTRNHYVLYQNKAGSWMPALISMSGTKIKSSRRWLSRIHSIEMKRADGTTYVPASFSHIYKISTSMESNKKGDWFSYDVNLVGTVDDANVYRKAKNLNLQFSQGEINVSPMEEDAI